MAKIELFLGSPTTADREDQIEELIYDLSISMETAVIFRARALIKWLSKPNKDDQNYLDLLATVDINHSVQLPKISCGVYKHNGYVLSKMIINCFHLKDMSTSNQYLISNKVIDVIGLDIENTFEFEYWGFRRAGKVIPSKSDVIYCFGDRPHIYHSGQFIAVDQRCAQL
jgi:hypothetical protein